MFLKKKKSLKNKKTCGMKSLAGAYYATQNPEEEMEGGWGASLSDPVAI